MIDRTKDWARARMTPSTWQTLSTSWAQASRTARGIGVAARRWATIGSDSVTSMRSARVEPWRILFAASIVLLPTILLGLFGATSSLTLPVIVFLLAIGLSTYIADWVGGMTSLIVAFASLELVFTGQTWQINLFQEGGATGTLVTFTIAGIGLIAMFESVKYDRANAKLESAAMRAANTAINAVEIAAAQRPAGDEPAFIDVLDTIMTAMVRVNRASAGAIYLVDDARSTLIRAVAYGYDESEALATQDANEISMDEGFAGRVLAERRAITMTDVLNETNVDDVLANNPHVRAISGVPLIDPSENVVGVAWVGLYVPYRFGQTAIARLQALGHRTVAFMEAARLADAQDALLDRVQDNHRRLQSVIQTIPEAVMVTRPPHGQIVASNAAAQRMFNVRTDAYLTRSTVAQLRISGDMDASEFPIMRAMNAGDVVTGVELTVTLPDGQEVPVVASAAPLFADDGAVDAAVAIYQDVAPLKEAERLRDEFISVVSHELRSPLTPIRGFAQVVARDLEGLDGHEQHIAWLDTLQRHVDRMTRLVDDLLDVSRLRAGRLEIRETDVDLVTLCQTVVESRQATSPDHDVILATSCDHVPLHADGDRIIQVLDNLVGNAVKYTPQGLIRVDLEADEGNKHARVSVSDEGKGIPPFDREYLFTPFYRSRHANESAVPGLGLGLYICRELVLAHGGEISVEGIPEGGSRFVVDLPLTP